MPAEPQFSNVIAQMSPEHQPFKSELFPFVTHLPVYHQNKEGHCGFYMFNNAKIFVRALLAKDKYSQILNLSKLKSGKEY